ncbi:carbohydrate sulfotransferase 15-like [Babylonia areolata]|uniref:carbohydrate sulfotransferase 15-like n=1 Tax=Babylonia areolata TaxID=304850 RepID=UPI003FCFC5FF
MNLRKRLCLIAVACGGAFCVTLLLVSLPGQFSLTALTVKDDECFRRESMAFEQRSVSAGYKDYVKPVRIKLEFVGEGFLHQNCCGRPNASAFGFVDPPQYMDNSKTPCWYEGGKLKCIPYFFMVGVFKCGTTDLFRRITRHPEVLMGLKEIHWFTKHRRFGEDFNWYVDQFAPLSEQIDKDLKSKGKSNLVVGEGSVSYFSDFIMWPNLMGNEFCSEPRVTVASQVHHLNPSGKIIISLRNPITRLYSKYLFTAKSSELFKNPSPEQFHEYVGKSIRLYTKCFQTYSVRTCVYNSTLARRSKIMIHEGLYSVFLEDWFRIFPRKQIYVARMEDYSPNIPVELERIYRFLELSPLTKTELDDIGAINIVNAGKNYDVGPMMNKSLFMLQAFYKPFNERLARLLKEERWTWKDQP